MARGKRPLPKSPAARVRGAAILVLDRRVRKLERAVFGEKSRIGFDVDVRGERERQDEDEPEIEEIP